ncbi:MAG TPA: TadE/TadG family type IV pilus assembly protein [Bellilinea sp.]|nr:TadE/TadG family type IV pilus assembly protein [Bellilinea sp.]
MSISNKSKDRKSRRGQGLVEFALAFPVFLLIILGIFEFGRLLVIYTSLYGAAREGARYGSAMENIPTCGAGIESNAQRIGFLAGNLDVTITYDSGPGTPTKSCEPNGSNIKLGDRVIVTASSPYNSVTGIVPAMTLESAASRTVIREVHLLWTLAPPSSSTVAPTATTDPGSPEATNTPSSPTVTPVPAGACDGTITWTAPNNSNTSTATFTNNSGANYTLTKLEVIWGSNKYLIEVVYVNGGMSLTIPPELGDESPALVLIPDPGWVIGTGTSTINFVFNNTNPKFIGVNLFMEDGSGTECQVK